MTLSNSFLVVLACFQKQGDNHESTGRSVSRWVMFHISENGFSINGRSWSTTLILRLTNNSVSTILWQISEDDEQFLTSYQGTAISETALGLVEGCVFKTLMGSLRVHTISFRSHTSHPSTSVPPSLPSLLLQGKENLLPWLDTLLWGCSPALRALGLTLLTGAHCRNRNHSWLLLTGHMKNY